MSYILEALTKSEQARLESAGAMRHSLLPASGAEAPQPPFWHYALLAGLVLINAMILYPHVRPAPPANPSETPANAPEIAARNLPQPREPAGALLRETARPAPVRRVLAPVATPPLRSLAGAAPRAPAAAAVPSAAAPAAPLHQRAETNPPPPPRTESTNHAEMPADLLKQLPPLAVAGYIRNGTEHDIVIVNDKLLREGDEVEPGLKLEKILGDGLVFNFKGYRFKR